MVQEKVNYSEVLVEKGLSPKFRQRLILSISEPPLIQNRVVESHDHA
jgi:hypothetical protein